MPRASLRTSSQSSDENGKKLTYATERTKEQIEQDRARRLGKEARAAGIYKADSPLQAIYIFVDEPESSVLARIFSVIIVLAISISSVLFVAETHSYVSVAPVPLSSRPLFRRSNSHQSCRRAVQGRSELSARVLRLDENAGAPGKVRGGGRLHVHILVVRCGCGGYLR